MSEPTPQECADWLSGAPLHPNTVTAVRYFREYAVIRSQLKTARDALEKAWLELESASHTHDCKSCRKGADKAYAALALIDEPGA